MSEKKLIVTGAGPNMADIMQSYALPTFEKYGDAFGYDVKADLIESDHREPDGSKSRAARWHKLRAMREGLQENDTVAWFDADVMVMRYDEDIAGHVAPDSFQAINMESVPYENRVNPNTGVWVMRNSPQTFDFLDQIEEIGMHSQGRWADAAAVMRVLGWHLGDVDDNYRWARPGLGSPFMVATSWLPGSWNQPYLQRQNRTACVDRAVVKNPHAIHFMGMSVLEREAVMANMFDKLKASNPAYCK